MDAREARERRPKRVLARLASLAQMQATPDLESDFVDTVYVTIYFSCHNNFLLSSELGALLRTTFRFARFEFSIKYPFFSSDGR